MFFLLRAAFWISLVLLVLPFGAPGAADGPTAGERASIDALSALAAAGATVSDMGAFCDRQPAACEVGGQALRLVGERAASGAAAIQSYLGGEAGPVEPAAIRPAVAATPQRGTLTPADRKPAWRGPAA
jgi:hypothetical protein